MDPLQGSSSGFTVKVRHPATQAIRTCICCFSLSGLPFNPILVPQYFVTDAAYLSTENATLEKGSNTREALLRLLRVLELGQYAADELTLCVGASPTFDGAIVPANMKLDQNPHFFKPDLVRTPKTPANRLIGRPTETAIDAIACTARLRFLEAHKSCNNVRACVAPFKPSGLASLRLFANIALTTLL